MANGDINKDEFQDSRQFNELFFQYLQEVLEREDHEESEKANECKKVSAFVGEVKRLEDPGEGDDGDGTDKDLNTHEIELLFELNVSNFKHQGLVHCVV